MSKKTVTTQSESPVEPITNQEVKSNKKEIKLDEHTLIRFSNNTGGVLVYTSPRTSETWLLNNYGDEDTISVAELRTMRSNHPRFFSENWIRILDEDAISFLKLEKYYVNDIAPERMEELFDLPLDEFNTILDKATNSIRSLIFSQAKGKYMSGELTNTHIIKAIEKKLNVVFDND